MLRFAKFLKKVELKLVTFRDGFQVEVARRDKFCDDFVDRSAVIIIHPETAKSFGFKDGQTVKVSANGRSINVRLKVSEIAPRDGALMPKSLYTSYISSDRVLMEPADGDLTRPEEMIEFVN